MYRSIVSPNILATSSSQISEDSLSHHVDRSIGVYIVDRYAYYTHRFIESSIRDRDSNVTIEQFLNVSLFLFVLSEFLFSADYHAFVFTVVSTEFMHLNGWHTHRSL